MKEHWLLLGWFVVSSMVNLLMRTKTAEEWDELAQKNARYASVARILRAVGVDPVKLIQSVVDFVRGESQKRLGTVAEAKADAQDGKSDASSAESSVEATEDKQSEGKDSK